MNEVLNELQPGDIVLTAQKGFILTSLPIRFSNFLSRGIENRLWTHAAMYIGDDYVIESIISPFKGVIKRKLSENYLNGKYDFIVLRRVPHTKYNFQKAVEYCKSNEGMTYDFKALSYFVLVEIIPQQLNWLVSNDIVNSILDNENSYFCSELVAESLLMSGDYCFDRPPSRIKPLDFLNNKYCFRVIHEQKTNEGWKKYIFMLGYVIGILFWIAALILIVTSIVFMISIIFMFIFRNIKKQEDVVLKNNN